MKNKVTVLMLSLFAATSLTLTAAPCTAPASGIVAWWPGQGNANDIIGGNNGSLVGTVGYTNGEVGQAFALSGSSAYISIPASSSLNLGTSAAGLTIEAWISPGASTIQSSAPIIEWDSSNAFGAHFLVASVLYVNLVDTSGHDHAIASGGVLTQGVLAHVAVTYNPSNGIAVLYFNGSAVATQNLGTFIPQTTYPVNIGRRTGSTDNGLNFAGLIDELSLYSRALTSNEIGAIYLAGSAGKCVPSPGIAPIITSQPTNLLVTVSNTAVFAVTASGTAPLTYQWKFGTTNLVGRTNAVLTLPNVQLAQAGNYSALVSNLYGFTNSAVAVLTVQTQAPPPSCTAPASGIVAWWPGQGNANDIISGNNGSLVGTVGYTNGEVGQAFTLSGSSAYITVPASSSLNIGASAAGMTIEAWISPGVSTIQNSAPIIEWDSSSAYGSHFLVASVLFVNLVDTSGQDHLIQSGGVLTQGVLAHVAVTYNPSNGIAVLYYNGNAVTTQNLGTFIPQTTYPVNIGRRTGSTDNGLNFAGSIDELSLYSRALSSNEVAAIYNAGSAGKCAPAGIAPIITAQPTNLTVTVSNTAVFSVAAAGTPPLTYQWKFGTTNLVGRTNSVLTLPNVQFGQAGNYSVLVSNLYGFTNSAVAVLTVQTQTPPPSCTAPASGIVAWWPGQGNANDIVGGNNGLLINSTGFTNGEVGAAFNLNGADNYILVSPATASLDVGAGAGYSMECWIKPATVTQQQLLAEYERVLGSGDGADVGIDFVIQSSAYLYANMLDNTPGHASHIISTPANSLVAGVWQHIAVTYDKASGLAALYINGTAAAQMNFGSFTPQTGYTNFLLGGRTYLGSAGSPNTVFSGLMDEFSVYGRALSSNEVAAIYNAGSAGKCAPVGIAPVITSQPTNLTVTVSNTAVFAVTATGTPPLTYQWKFGTTNLVGRTNAILTLPNVQLAQAGNYSVLVSNLYGFTNSAVAVLTVQTQAPPPSCTAPASGIVAWWPGQGNANDIIGGNSGSLAGTVGFTTGKVGQAFFLNGSNAYITVPASPSLNIGASAAGMTIEAWISPGATTLQTSAPIVEWDSGTAFGAHFWVADVLFANIVDTAGNNHQIQSGSVLTAGVLAHVAVTYNPTNGNAVLYYNGSAVTTQNLGIFVPQTTYPVNIGRRTGNIPDNNLNFAGLIDELSLYNRALASSEIAAIYNAGSAGKCAPVGIAPVITSQPTNLTVTVSNTAVFAVAATGTPPLTYQWKFGTTNLVGRTNAILTLPNVQFGQAGNYSVLVSNLYGFTNSAVAVLTVQTQAPPPSCTAPASGIAAWWPGQVSTSDVIGMNNGTPVGSLSYTNGKVGTAFVFDGSTYIPLPASPSLNIGSSGNGLTIEAWVKPTASDNAPIIEWDSASIDGMDFWVGNNSSQDLFAIRELSGTQHALTFQYAYDTNNFQHVAATYNPTSGLAVLYINGASVASANWGSFTPQTTYPVNIGRRTGQPNGNGNTYSGLLDELSLYNRALTSNEIAAIYNAGSAGKCAPVGIAPVITSQPTNLTVTVSNTAVFAVTATGTPPLTYQWKFGTTNLVGRTNAILTLPNVQLAQAGNYSVLVSNLYGFTNSAVAVLTVQTQAPPPSCTAPASGIVAWWPGQGNANDIIGGNSGSLAGTVGFTTGKVGQAFFLNGSNAYITVPASPSLNIGASAAGMTIEAWISPGATTLQTSAPIVEWDSGTAFGAHFWVADVLFANIVDTAGNNHQIQSGSVLTAGVLAHVAVTYNPTNGNAVLYYNGSAVTTQNLGIFVPQTTYPVNIGRRTGNIPDNNLNFAGLIDELSLYNRALASSEIAAIYNAGSAGKCAPVGIAPVITSQPTNLTVTVSNTAVFAVAATGTPPLTYQWKFGTTNLVGRTNAILTLPNVQFGQAGNYSVLVSNLYGFTNSAVAVLTVQTQAPPPSCTAPASGIVAWWPGQGNANDIIGGNNGSLVGALGYTNGEVGQAFSLDGTSTYVTVPAAASLDLGASTAGMTIEGWISPNALTVQYTAPVVEWDSPSAIGLHFWASDSLYANLIDTNGNDHIVQSPNGLMTAGVLAHVAMTYNPSNGTVVMYCNGSAVKTQNVGIFVPQTTYPVNIGRRTVSVGSGYNFSGTIDELSLYKRALSSNEIAAIYLAGSAGKCAPVGSAPAITSQPQSRTNVVGTTASFSVTATGTPPLSYRWKFGSTNISSGTNATLTLPNVQLTQAGNYSVLVSNLYGFTNSAVAVLTVQTQTPPPPSCTAPASGIVAWWPGQGNANDIIGGNNGSLVGTVGYTNGEVGQAFALHGSSAYITVPASSSLNLGASATGLTIEAWISPGASTIQSSAPIIEWDSSSAFGTHFLVASVLFANLVDTSGHDHIIQSGGVLTQGVLAHVAVTYNPSNGIAVLYYNGNAVTTQNLGTFIPQTTYPVNIGRRTGSTDNGLNFAGSIDELSLYSRALSSNEIAVIYLAGSAGKCTPAPTVQTALTLGSGTAYSGSTIVVPVIMNAVGVENTFLATVGYDPTKLVLQNVQLGSATAGAYLQEVDTRTNSGLVGFAILLNSGVVVPAGTNKQVALLNFQALPVTSNTTVSLYFTNSPTLQQTYDNSISLLPTIYSNGAVTLLPAEYEADVFPHTNGDHSVTVQDWLEEGRLVAGLDTPTNSDELLRADCAPRNAADGVLTVADWVQAGRYALGLDPLTLVSAPITPHAQFKSSTLARTSAQLGFNGGPAPASTTTRILQIGSVTVQRGQTVNVPVELVCTTNENAVGLTVSFNPSQLQVTGVALGSAMAGGRTNINSSQPGKLGVVVALSPGAALNPGANQVLVLQITASPDASGIATLTLDGTVAALQVADKTANALAANYVNGAVVLPPQPVVTATGAGAGAGLQLSWPMDSGTFQVQTADSPMGPWTTVVMPIITNGASATVIVSPTNQHQYFRLEGQ